MWWWHQCHVTFNHLILICFVLLADVERTLQHKLLDVIGVIEAGHLLCYLLVLKLLDEVGLRKRLNRATLDDWGLASRNCTNICTHTTTTTVCTQMHANSYSTHHYAVVAVHSSSGYTVLMTPWWLVLVAQVSSVAVVINSASIHCTECGLWLTLAWGWVTWRRPLKSGNFSNSFPRKMNTLFWVQLE